MKEYKFFDTDATGKEDYDIFGNDYQNLINICCKYCTTISFRIKNLEIACLAELSKFNIPKQKNILYVYNHYYDNNESQTDVKYYRICPDLNQILLKTTDSLFNWIYGWGFENPEDPVFYRKDGSVFFSSLIHEGECSLFPQKGEDISSIISTGLWSLQ